MINIPKGTKDVLPAEAYKWHFVENTARRIAALYGLREIRTPTFEHTELFLRSVGDILEETEPGSFHVHMYMNVDDYDHYHLCENVYDGRLTHFDTLSMLVLQNQHMEMDHYQVGIPSPFMNAPVKWGLAFGISSRPLMPTATKVLFARAPQKETPEFEKSLRLSKEDIRLMKLYNMLTIL